MSRGIENVSHRHQAPGPSFPSRKLPLMPTLVIAGGALIAFFIWTVPNWSVFAQNVGRFSALWQIVVNRHAIIILVIKIFSPILVVPLLAACIWLWYLLKPFLQETTPRQVSMRASQAEVRQNGWPSTAHAKIDQFVSQPVTNVQKINFPQINSKTPIIPMLDPNVWDNGTPSTKRGEVSLQVASLQQHRDLHGKSEEQYPYTERAQEELPPANTRRQQASVGEGETAKADEQEAPGLAAPRRQGGEQQQPYTISITLLKRVSITLLTDQGTSRKVPLVLNAKRVQLLAYIAWLRDQPVNRDRMLEQVFGHGKNDEEATREKLGESFDSHKKFIRWDLRRAINQLNADAGVELIPPDLDIFSHKQRLYWLSKVCHVIDLQEIEMQHQVIELARKDGQLVDQIPDSVKKACDQLMAAYSGDFLEELVTDYLEEFEPWVSSWARKPYTLFRDYFLQALWYAAEYELRQGQQFSNEHLEGESSRKEQRKHWGQAAQHYRTYAMTACNSRFDMKVTFGGGGREQGERIIMSERALRRSLVLYGSIGATHQVDQVYSAYYKQMRSMSAKVWEPSKETLNDLRSAKEQTNAYRFPTQVMPHEPLPSIDTSLETSA